MHKYKTFVEILESADREKAVFSAFFKGIKEDVSYGTFLDTIRSYPEIKGKTFAGSLSVEQVKTDGNPRPI